MNFLLDGLLHGVQVEGVELAVSGLAAKLLQRRRLGRGSERKVAGVLAHLALVHRRKNLVLHIHWLFTILARQGFVHLVSGHAGLGRVRLVDDDGELAVRQLPDAIHDERELLHRGDDDLSCPSSRLYFSSCALSQWATMFLVSENSLMLSLSWVSSTRDPSPPPRNRTGWQCQWRRTAPPADRPAK
jgi:hypothetical protein